MTETNYKQCLFVGVQDNNAKERNKKEIKKKKEKRGANKNFDTVDFHLINGIYLIFFNSIIKSPSEGHTHTKNPFSEMTVHSVIFFKEKTRVSCSNSRLATPVSGGNMKT